MQLERKKPRLPRVERSDEAEPDQEENLLWAVSYSDLLMVLMSFFVIFFAASKNKREAVFKDVNVALNKNVQGEEALGTGKGGSDGAGDKGYKDGMSPVLTEEEYAEYKKQAEQQAAVEAKIKKSVSVGLSSLGINLDVTNNPLSMTVNFPDDLYSSGQFDVNRRTKLLLNEIFNIITTHQSELDVHFIGHSDANPLKNGNAYISSNYSLSALRAAKALEYSIKLGYPQDQLYAKGGAANLRNSRTLSVKLVMRPLAKLVEEQKQQGIAH